MEKIEDVLSCDPEIVSGAVVFRGTRVPVSALFNNLEGDYPIDDFHEDFPRVERQQVQAVLAIACSLIEAEFD